MSDDFGQRDVIPEGSEDERHAWCSECEKVRIAEGGEWNERSEEFAGVTVICGSCYEAKKRNAGGPKKRKLLFWRK